MPHPFSIPPHSPHTPHTSHTHSRQSFQLFLVPFAHIWSWQLIEVGFASMVLHSFLDLPVHNNDAHRHFFPFSNYRFISPVSYWDSNHYGAMAALVEILLVLGATIYLFPSTRTYWGKGLLIAVNLFFMIGYFRFYLLAKGN
ncbi:hypothetical protein [Nostoc sp.]|uniref:hypothetical protein n=1 Tax=Nostoc sp. TaxID=1180 RepID=UPI002FF66293